MRDDDALIVAIGRSPIGRAHKGSLKATRPDDLMAQVAGGVLRQLPEPLLGELDDFYLGCGFPEGEQGMNIARRVAVLLGADSLPATTVNRFCASSLQATRMAFHAIRAGEGHSFLVGGVESSSRSGTLEQEEHPAFASAHQRVARVLADGAPWTDPRAINELPDVYLSMGHTAELVARLTGTTRQEQDEFAAESQRRAEAALASGQFRAETIPVTLPDGTTMTVDESPRPGTSVEKLATLDPVFLPDRGTVTAGNACPMNDGASAAVVVSGAWAKRHPDVQPLARILSTGVSALSPEVMGLGPVEASRRAMDLAGLTTEEIDIFEINEAFAAQVIPAAKQLGIDRERLNPFGGAIALGHPFGATGVRMLATLLGGLQARDERLGLATMCVAGGQGMAMIIERL